MPEKKELVVLLDNTSRGDKLDDIAAGVLSILHGIEAKTPRKSIVEDLGAPSTFTIHGKTIHRSTSAAHSKSKRR